MDLTYQQILAEQYDENAKNLLVTPNEAASDEYVDEYEYDDYEKNDLPNKEEFNKFQGDRNKPEHVIKPLADNQAKHRSKVRLRNRVVNIDGKFRGNISAVLAQAGQCNVGTKQLMPDIGTPGTTSSYFIFQTARVYKNVSSIKLTSFEFPNVFYTFSSSRNNISFQVDDGQGYRTVSIPQGNYSSATLLATTIQTIINSTSGLNSSYTVAVDPISSKLTIADTNTRPFNILFPTTINNPTGNGIGYNLGFQNTAYNFASTYTAENFPDVVQDTYIYLSINDYNLVEHHEYGQTHFEAIAKITLPSGKNTIVYDNNFTNSSSKQYHFYQPTNISRFEIKLIDAYGEVLDLQGSNFSMTLELEEILDSSIYEKMLEL